MKKNGEPLAFTDATATIIKVAPKIANDKWLQTFFFTHCCAIANGAYEIEMTNDETLFF